MRLMHKMELSLTGLAIMALLGCEDPQSLNNRSVVNNPFVQRTDTLSQVVGMAGLQDSVNWATVSRLEIGSLPGYKTGIHFKILLDNTLVDSVVFDSVYVRFERDLLYRSDPNDQTLPGPVDVNLYDARNVAPDAASDTWGDLLSTTQMTFGDGDTTLIIQLDRDSVLSTLQYDSLKVMDLALNIPASPGLMQRFYSVETAFQPKVYFKYAAPDTTISRIIVYDAPVVSWNPAELDTLNYQYVSALGAQKLQVLLNSDSLNFPAGEVLQHVIKAQAVFTVDSAASRIYLQSKVDSIPAMALNLRQLDADTCNCNSLSFNFKAGDNGQTSFLITSIMQAAVAEPNRTTSFFIRPLNAGLTPGLLAIPKNQTGQPVMKVIVTSARVEAP